MEQNKEQENRPTEQSEGADEAVLCAGSLSHDHPIDKDNIPKEIMNESNECIGSLEKVYELGGTLMGEIKIHDKETIDLIKNGKWGVGGSIGHDGKFNMTHVALVPKK